jgi:transposase InsO family protein
MIEAFWSRMQVELLDRKVWKTRLELANAMFDYLEIWHNRRRRQQPARDAHTDRVREHEIHHGGMRFQQLDSTEPGTDHLH